MNPEEIKIELLRINTRAKKSFGQNFLINDSVLKKIIESAEIKSGESILEIGPGLGVLTDGLLCAGGRVTAIEADQDFYRYLKDRFKNEKLKLFLGDAVTIIDRLDFKQEVLNSDYKVVANIPYSITSKLLRLLLESPRKPRVIILLVQWEVAKRITALVGEMSLLSLSVQYFGRPEIIEKVSRASFWPAPAVDSAIIKVSDIRDRFSDKEERDVFRLARIGFAARRKTLANNLATGFHLARPMMVDIMKESRLSENIRAQELTIDDWLKLFENLRRAGVVKQADERSSA